MPVITDPVSATRRIVLIVASSGRDGEEKSMGMRLRDVPTRLATGAYILHSGITKLKAGPELAAGLHASAAGAYPVLKDIPSTRFVRALAVTEITVGSLLLAPFIPTAVAAVVLTGFSSGLVGMYLRTPALRKPGSIWPSQAGTAVSKDSWMLGIGLGMLIGAAERRRGRGEPHAPR